MLNATLFALGIELAEQGDESCSQAIYSTV